MSSHSDEELRSMRHWYASTCFGKKYLLKAFRVLTEGKKSPTYKDVLLDYYKLRPSKKDHPKKTPEELYENDFKENERLLLEDKSTDPDKFDVSLLNKLLRRLKTLTRLAFDYHKVWTDVPPKGTKPRIEYMITCITQNRNESCHPNQTLSKDELSTKLQKLENLLKELIDKVFTTKGKAAGEILKIKSEITKDFKDLRDPIKEALTETDIEQYFEERRNIMKKKEKEATDKTLVFLKDKYQDTYESYPVGFLGVTEPLDTEEMYTSMALKEYDKNSTIAGKQDNERLVDFRDILILKTKTGKIPRIISLTSVGGNGKTTTTRLFVCTWCRNPGSIPGLSNIAILLFIEFRYLSNTENSFDALIQSRLGTVITDVGLTVEQMRNILLASNILVILDGQDESTQANNCLLKDLLRLVKNYTNMRLIISSRPNASKDLQSLITSTHLPNLEINIIGISKENQKIFIERLLVAMKVDPDELNRILESVENELPDLNSSMVDTMSSPLMLTLLTILLKNRNVGANITATEIFSKVEDQLEGKLEERLKSQCVIDDTMKNKIKDFVVYLRKVASKTFSQNEIIFKDSTVDLLRNKLKELNLDNVMSEILEHYLDCRKYQKGSKIVICFSFRHLRLHEYACSVNFCFVLSSGNEKEKVAIMNEIQDERYSNIRAHLIAILAKSYPQLLTEYGKQIVECEKDVDGLLGLVRESKQNDKVIEFVSSSMSEMEEWEVKSSSSVVPLQAVMESTAPKRLILEFSSQNHIPASLPSCLQVIKDHSLGLTLYLPVNSTASQEAPHNEVLLSTGPGPCRLVGFRGCISAAVMDHLSPTLRSLRVGTTPQDLHALFHRIPHLTQLGVLCKIVIYR